MTKSELRALIVASQHAPQRVGGYTITATQVYPRPARPGRAWYWVYQVSDIAGRTVFDNRRADSLAAVMLRVAREGGFAEVSHAS